MVKKAISFFLLLASTIMAMQLTLIDASSTPHSFDLSTLQITFSGETLITNQGYSVPMTSLTDVTFGAGVSTKRNNTRAIQPAKSLYYKDSRIIYTPNATGNTTVEVFNSLGRRVAILFNGNVKRGEQKSFELNISQGYYYIHIKSPERSETYAVGM